jgi:hypothetical protein
MRILLKVPPTWYVEPLRSGLTHYRMPDAPNVRILVSALIPLPDDVPSWRARELYALVPDDCELAIVDERTAFSKIGWPLSITAAECRRGGVAVESWLAVFYQAAGTGAVALVRAPRGELEPAMARVILGILATARPDVAHVGAETWGGLCAPDGAGKARA